MKFSGMVLFMLILFSFSTGAYSQLWKQYSDSAKKFTDKRELNKAIEYYIMAKEELKKDSLWTNSHAGICNSLAIVYINTHQFEKAEPLYLEVIKIQEKVLGNEHPQYATTCNNLAVMYVEMGQYERAEPLYLEAKKIREKRPGREHPDYVGSCNNLANLYMTLGQYEKAEPLYMEAKQISEKVFGKQNPSYARSCNSLAGLYGQMGQFEKAEPLYLEAKRIREKAPGKGHPDYAGTCTGLAALYKDMGQYEKAEPLYLEAKQIIEQVFGSEHLEYAKCCNNLATLYDDKGQYEKAEPLYLKAKQIREKVLGKNNSYYAGSCNNLAALYYYMGQYEKAASLYLEAKQIREKVFGKEHPEYAGSCNNLAALYNKTGQYEKAEPLYLEARQIWGKKLGKEHPDYAFSCNNLALLYVNMNQYEKAEPLYLEAKKINEKILGKEHPDYALNCDNLAILYFNMDQYGKAEPLFLEAKKINEIVLGKMHPAYIQSCRNLAILYGKLKKHESAYEFYKESFTVQYNLVRKIFQFTSETEKLSYVKKVTGLEKYILSFNTTTNFHSRQGFTYNVSLANRNLILSSSRQLRSAIYNNSDTSIQNRYNSWINLRKQLSLLYTKPIAERPAYTNDLEEQANTLEKELTRFSVEFKNQQAGKEPDWKLIQQSLQPNEAAIEFAEFGYFDGKRWTDSTFYVALLLRKDKQEPRLIQLFEKKQLDTLLNNTGNQAIDNTINALYTGNTSVYDLTWNPLEKYLKGISKIYFAAAGNLFKISFAGLPINDKQVLGDKYRLIQLNTTAAVTDKNQTFITASAKIQLFGGVQYDADAETLKQATSTYRKDAAATQPLPGDIIRGAGFYYLPGTLREVETVKKLSGNTNTSVTILSGINATEESIKSLSGQASPSVLHIATHGFFFPDPKESRGNDMQEKPESGGKAFRQSDNPLFRSGLLFAGANNAWQGSPVEGTEDGILTAYEVSNMYLPNTKLVVLSACETALGDIQGSEGVYGLQRAFKIAGVQNLVMSLWKIGDKETSEFMQLFYKNLFNKQSVNDAFYDAQTIMKNKYRNEPYKWAAWVLVR